MMYTLYCQFQWVFCLIIVHTTLCNAEYYSATTELSRAFEVGRQLASDLTNYLDLEEARLNRIRRLANRLSTKGMQQGLSVASEDFFGNPVNAYLTVKRLAVDWKSELLTLLDGYNEEEQYSNGADGAPSPSESLVTDKQQLLELRSRVEQTANLLPGHNDVTGAAEALLLLQKTYKLRARDIANGKLTTELTCPRLTAAQCMHLGQQAYLASDFLKAEEWFRVAYYRLWEELSQDTQNARGEEGNQHDESSGDRENGYDLTIPDEARPTNIQILDHLAYALGRQGRYAEALNVTRLILEEDPENEQSLNNEVFYEERIKHGEGIIGPATSNEKLSKLDEETEIYQALCRNEQVFPPPPADKVYCRYYVPHPYYTIGPVKEEILFPDPRIVLWYDVIHPSEVEKIQALALPRLRRATVKNPVTGRLENAHYRTSKSAWLPDGLDEVTHRINQRIHALTGLSMETAEDLQVGNYGIGGYYAPHFDFGRKREKDAFEIENGNRIATIIFYLTDVKAGGATVFNRVGAVVNPVRGAAGFWYNLYPSGEGDLRTRHVACPVLVGSKWVMNVWFHERGQEFRRPCELNRGPVEIDDGF